jgi:hypothetical protein
MVGGLEERGVIDEVADWLAETTEGSRTAEGMAILWGSAGGSALVDNIPFTTAMLPVVDRVQGAEFDDGLWWSLSLGPASEATRRSSPPPPMSLPRASSAARETGSPSYGSFSSGFP